MLRICAALIAAATVSGAASAAELKPKFGDIGGVYYTDVSENREACRQAIRNKIALCRQNTSFVSNTLDRKYPGCLPIFRNQSRGCADHFRSEAYKCQGSGPVRIADFTGFACTVTRTVVEEGGEPEGGTGSRDPAPEGRGSAAHLSPKCVGMGKGAKCWLELANRRGCYIFDTSFDPASPLTWSGGCAGGVAVGRGTIRSDHYKITQEGSYANGKRHGRWVLRWDNGLVAEGSLVDGEEHGRWVVRYTSGGCNAWHYRHGRRISGPSKC